MKFLLDMDIFPSTASFLRDLGHDASHLMDEGLCGLPDQRVLSKAREEARILLTHDLDFSNLIAASGWSLPSVIIFRLRDMRPVNVNRALEGAIARHAEQLEEGAILSVVETRIRIRMLPVGDQ